MSFVSYIQNKQPFAVGVTNSATNDINQNKTLFYAKQSFPNLLHRQEAGLPEHFLGCVNH